MFLPLVICLFFVALICWRLRDFFKKGDLVGFRKGTWALFYCLAMALFFYALLAAGKNDPRAWGVGPTTGCIVNGC
jgi:hypothetical protein